MITLFNRVGPLAIFLILLAGVAVWFPSLQEVPEGEFFYDAHPMPLYELLRCVLPLTSVWTGITMLAFVFIMAFFLNRFNGTYFFITFRTYLPAFFYVLLSGFFPVLQRLNPVIPGSFFLVLAISRLIDSYKVKGIANHYFEAGILLGVASLFYLNFIWFLLFLWIAKAILRSGRLREYLLALFGLMTPHLLVAAYYFLLKDDLTPYLTTLQQHLIGRGNMHHWSSVSLIVGALGGVIILVASGHMIRYFNTKKIRSRTIFSLMFWLAVFSILVFLLVPTASVEMVYVLSIPLSYLLAHYFAHKRQTVFAKTLFALFVLGMLLLVYFPWLRA
jgi:hypothetical protein